MKSSFCIDLQRFMLIPTKFPLSPPLSSETVPATVLVWALIVPTPPHNRQKIMPKSAVRYILLKFILEKQFGFFVIIVKRCDVQFIEFRMSFDSDLPSLPCRYCPVTTSLTLELPANVMLTHVVIILLFCFGL